MGNNNNNDKIKVILENNPNGLTIRELVESSGLSRQTIATILAEFRGAKLITERLVGQAKLICWKDVEDELMSGEV